MPILSALLRRLDADPARRGRQFETICRWYLTQDPLYAHELRRVWLWNEWPGRWGADAGIDLVAEDVEGRLWAIQAKAYDPAHAVTKADVDSFLSESNRPEFSYRLLIATTDRIGATARRTLEGQEKQVGYVGLAQLEAAELDWPRSPTELSPRPRRRKKPRPHQRQAVSAVVGGFGADERGQLVMACGTGKTLVSLFATEAHEATRTLVLLPSLSLLSQTLREWVTNATVSFAPLAVCSDDTVAERDAVVSTTTELGMPVTTDAAAIAKFLRRRGRRVVFSTYQSSPRIADAFALGGVPHFDLAVADEAHRCAGRVSSDFSTVLSDTAIPARRRLFMTATPRYFTGKVLREAKEADLEVASMDDESVFGRVFYRLSFGEAISRGLLSDYQVVVVGIDDATYAEWVARGRLVTFDGVAQTDARALAGQIGLAKAIRGHCLRRAITFHSRVASARHFARSLPAVIDWMPVAERPDGAVWAEVVTGEMSAGTRNLALRRLRDLDTNTSGVLTNARCLTEGVDVPTLDGVAFIDTRRSEVEIVQALGRAIRKAADKKIGTIVLPVFVKSGDDAQRILDDSAFRPVWDVLKALRAHDTELGSALDELRREIGRGSRAVRLPDKIVLDLPTHVTAEFAAAFNVRAVEATTRPWEFWFGLLQRYVEREGHSRVPVRWKEGTALLGSWIAGQRQRYGDGAIEPTRAALLESLPGWTWNTVDDAWESGFSALQTYVVRTGTARVPQRHAEGGVSLGFWVNQQRLERSIARQDPSKRARLEALPGWSWDLKREAWEAAFALLQAYVAEFGSADVISREYKEFPLAEWAISQRKAFSARRLNRETIERLEAISGWWWRRQPLSSEGIESQPITPAWYSKFAVLEQYVDEYGLARVPQAYVTSEGVKLGYWVTQQRAKRKRNRLSNEQCRLLESLEGWAWDPRSDRWEQCFTYLKQYTNREGTADVPGDHIEDGFPLGKWVTEQRRPSRPLSQQRRQQLAALKGWRWIERAGLNASS